MIQGLRLTPKGRAHCFAVGYSLMVFYGILGCVATVLVALWGLFELVQILLSAFLTCCSAIGQMYESADSLVQFLIWLVIGLVVYRVVRKIWRELI